MSNSPRGEDQIHRASVKKDQSSDQRHITQDKLNKIGREIDPDQHTPYEVPLKLILGFFQIYFDGHIAHFALLLANSMDDLMHYNSVINPFSAWNKGCLHQRYKLHQIRSKPGYYYFHYYLVDSVAQTDRSIIAHELPTIGL